MKLDLDSTQKFLKFKNLSSNSNSKAIPVAATVTQPKLGVSDSKKVPSSSPDYNVSITKPDLPVPKVSLPDINVSKPIEKIAKIETTTKVETEKKPALIFISGLDLFSGGYSGLSEIADSIEGSEIFKWNETDKIIDKINRTDPDYPVILVGHSLGGDTAYEIADKLDSLEHKFRGIDLLVTVDAIGFNHDVIPQNVKKHLNVFGENSLFLKDGPHVARREEKTSVRNILSPLDHTQIDDDREVQFEIVRLIQENVKKKGS